MLVYESNRTSPTGGIYHQRNDDLEFYRHLHNSFELIYVYEGIFEVIIGDVTYTVRAGEAILIFPNQIHYAECGRYAEKPRTYLCIFQNDLIGEFYHFNKGKIPRSPVFPVPDPALIERIASFNGSRYLLKSYLYELLNYFDEHCDMYTPEKKCHTERMGEILVYISEHHTENIRMQDVAKEIGYDYHYLSNLLQKGLNTTFRTVLNEYRVSHAKYLLTTSSDIITQISYECGYESLCSFNRNFKKLTGITPSEYRESKQKDECRHIYENDKK